MSEVKFTPGPWFVSGVRHRMNGCEWHSINRYDEASKKDENIACVGYDPRTNLGFDDARLIAAAPDLREALIAAKQAMWLEARHQWTMVDFKNWAVIQQIDAALEKADGNARAAIARARGDQS